MRGRSEARWSRCSWPARSPRSFRRGAPAGPILRSCSGSSDRRHFGVEMKPSQRRDEVAPVGSFEEQVMLAVLRAGAGAYGMNVRRELEEVTGRDVTIGSVYATLDRLEAKGL